MKRVIKIHELLRVKSVLILTVFTVTLYDQLFIEVTPQTFRVCEKNISHLMKIVYVKSFLRERYHTQYHFITQPI